MSVHPWLKVLTLVPAVIALLLMIGLACGGSAEPAVVEKKVSKEVEKPVKAVEKPAAVEKEAVQGEVMTPTRGGIPRMHAYANPAHFGTHRSGSASQILHSGPLYNQLVEVNLESPNFEIQGDLAKSWKISTDGTEFTFQLNENALWSDGKPVTAEDVVFSLDRMVLTDAGPRPRVGELKVFYEGSEALGTSAVKVKTKFPAPGLLDVLAVDVFKILPKHWAAPAPDGQGKEIWIPENTLGSGPFILKEFTKDVGTKYERNLNYFKEGLPNFDGMEYFIITDKGAAIAAYAAEQVLMSASVVSRIDIADALRLEQDWKGKISFHPTPGVAQVGLMINTKKDPWTDPNVRLALQLAINRAPINTAINADVTDVGTPMEPGSWYGKSRDAVAQLPGFRTTGDGKKHPDDIAKARELLAAAGFPDGLKTVLTVRTSGGPFVDIAGLVKPQLKEFLNIDVEIRALESAAGFRAYKTGDFDLAIQGQGFNFVGPDSVIAQLFREGGGRNYSDWSHPKIDELYEQQIREFDLGKRSALIQQIEDILLTEDTPWVGLYWQRYLWPVNNKIQNFRAPPSGQVGFKHEHLWLKE